MVEIGVKQSAANLDSPLFVETIQDRNLAEDE